MNQLATQGETSLPASGPDWAQLKHDCIVRIFSNLSSFDLWTGAMFICKSWHRASTDPLLHSVFDMVSAFDDFDRFRRFWKWRLPELEIKFDSMLMSAIHLSNGSLTEIRTSRCSDHAISVIAERCPNLTVLCIECCQNLTDKCLSRIAVNWPKLTVLSIRWCNLADKMLSHIVFKCPNLQELDVSGCREISHKSLALIGQNCPNLRTLKMLYVSTSCGNLEANVIGKYMTGLKCLVMMWCSELSASGLTSICDGCTELEYLDLFGCENLTHWDIENATRNLNSLKEIVMPGHNLPMLV